MDQGGSITDDHRYGSGCSPKSRQKADQDKGQKNVFDRHDAFQRHTPQLAPAEASAFSIQEEQHKSEQQRI